MISRIANLLEPLNKIRSLLLLGPRGTGKTTLLHETLKGFPHPIFIDLLRGNSFQRYSSTPSQLGDEIRAELSKRDSSLIVAIDEVQKVPALLDEVHSVIEEYKTKVAFLLSGSSARKLKRGGANLLAGRAITKALHPLSSLELELDLSRVLKFGSLPSIYLDTSLEIATLDSYVSTYLREEIQQESIVRRIDRFSRFLEFAAQLNGEPINFSKLGKQSGIVGKTAIEYYSILTDTLIAKMIPGWSHSVKKQLLQSPKYYFFDCGVLNAIQGYLRAEIKSTSFHYGKLFETFIVQEIVRANDYLDLGLKFNYWRDKMEKEVDLILSRNAFQPLLAIEIKSHTHPSPSDCDGFPSFAEDYPMVPRICVCTTPLLYKKEGVEFVPWQTFIRNISSYL